MTPDEIEALVLAAVARDRARRWGYEKTLGDGVVEFLAKQVTDTNLVDDVRVSLSALNDTGLLMTEEKERVIHAACEWRDASLFDGEVGLSFGERLNRLDEATPALQRAVDCLRSAAKEESS